MSVRYDHPALQATPDRSEQRTGWDIPAQVYLVEHQLWDGRTRISVGATRYDLHERFSDEDFATISNSTVFPYSTVSEAEIVEGQLIAALGLWADHSGLQLETKTGWDQTFEVSWDKAKQFANLVTVRDAIVELFRSRRAKGEDTGTHWRHILEEVDAVESRGVNAC